ncbi:MAG: sporulation integral membrane protein YtvI [Lachnospiraceae bacterium]
MHDRSTYAKIVVNFLVTLAGILFVVFLGPKLLKFFLPFVIAFIISSIANPLVRFMEKKIKIVRKHSSAIIIILVLGAVVGILYLLGALVVKQVVSLFEDRFELYNQMMAAFDMVSESLNGLFERLPGGIKDTFLGLQSDLGSALEGFLTGIELPSIAAAGSYVKSVADGLLIAIITVLAAYFLIAERDNIAEMLVRILPKSILDYYRMIVSNIKKAVGGYFKAQFKIMLILMAVMFIGFEILDIGYSLLLAFLIAFLDFLPVFGTGAVFWPWIVIDIIAGNYTEAIFLGVLYLLCQLIKQILQPKMVGDSVGINPLAALVFMFIGYRLSGVLGMIVGIPVGMIVISLYQAGAFERLMRGFKIIVHDINEFRKF